MLEIVRPCNTPEVLDSVPPFGLSNQSANDDLSQPFPTLEMVPFSSNDSAMTNSCTGRSKCADHRGTVMLRSHNMY